jgi:hypothetical protein
METLVKWSVFERHEKGAGPDPAALLKGMCVRLVLISAHANINHPSGTHVETRGKPCCYFGIYFFLIKSVIYSQHPCKQSTL